VHEWPSEIAKKHQNSCEVVANITSPFSRQWQHDAPFSIPIIFHNPFDNKWNKGQKEIINRPLYIIRYPPTFHIRFHVKGLPEEDHSGDYLLHRRIGWGIVFNDPPWQAMPREVFLTPPLSFNLL
jgi:hypothetical protein